MNSITLEAGKLYLLSGPPAAGKSTWVSSGNIPADFVISKDELRVRLLGAHQTSDTTLIYQKANGPVNDVLKVMLETRLAEKLTTFIDATLVTEAERHAFAHVAAAHGVETEVLIFDRPLETLLARNTARRAKVPSGQIESFARDMQLTSTLPFRLIGENTVPHLVPRSLPDARVDVIGDVHGLMEELLELLDKLGYQLSDGVPVHPEGRHLLFLGDIVDRGPQSIEVLQFVRHAVMQGGHFMVAGNHERKLLQFWDAYRAGRPEARSFSSAQTAMAFMHLKKAEQHALVQFLRYRPGSYVFEGFAFAHADLTYFNPFTTLHSECLYGCEYAPKGSTDNDGRYARAYPVDNPYKLVRGHIQQTSVTDVVFSLEDRQAYCGRLLALRLDAFIEAGGDRAAFETALVAVQSSFNFDDVAKDYRLRKAMDTLAKDKLVTARSYPEAALTIYKYSKQCFYDHAWGDHDALLKARGLVLDLAGNVVSHPFDKVFNYGEVTGLGAHGGEGAGMLTPNDTEVIVVEKLNGFLGIISKNPMARGQLLAHTQGTFEGEYVQYIKDLLPLKQVGPVNRFLANNKATLLFEAIHPADPHIITYGPEDHGLWLIGVRGTQLADQAWTEDQVDAVALELGFRRPKWFRTTKGAVLDLCAKSSGRNPLEGWMVRAATPEQPHLFKLKTPYYLTTKFLGRLTAGKVKHMFNNPADFKQTQEEEFFWLVDALTSRYSCEAFIGTNEQDRLAVVRQLIVEQLTE